MVPGRVLSVLSVEATDPDVSFKGDVWYKVPLQSQFAVGVGRVGCEMTGKTGFEVELKKSNLTKEKSFTFFVRVALRSLGFMRKIVTFAQLMHFLYSSIASCPKEKNTTNSTVEAGTIHHKKYDNLWRILGVVAASSTSTRLKSECTSAQVVHGLSGRPTVVTQSA